MNTEELIRQAVRNTINFEGCTESGGPPRFADGEDRWKWDFERNSTDAEVFENRVMYHFNAIQYDLAKKKQRQEAIPVNLEELDENYMDGFETGLRWTHPWPPGGPWFYRTGNSSEREKGIAMQLEGNHFAWLQGWHDGKAAQG